MNFEASKCSIVFIFFLLLVIQNFCNYSHFSYTIAGGGAEHNLPSSAFCGTAFVIIIYSRSQNILRLLNKCYENK